MDELDARKREADPEYPHSLLENLLDTSGEEISKAQVNQFLKKKVIEHTEVAPGKMSKTALKRQAALLESKKKTRQKYAAKWTEAEL